MPTIVQSLRPVAEQDHCDQENGTVNDVSHRFRQRRRLQHAAHGGKQKRTTENTEIMAAPAGNPRSAKNHNRNRSQQVGFSHVVVSLIRKAGQQEAYNCGAKPAQNIDGDRDRPDVYAGEPRHPFTIAHGTDAAAEAAAI